MWKTTDRYIQQVGRGGVGGSVGLGGLPQVLFPPPLSLFSPLPNLFAEEAEGSGSRQQAEAGVHPHLVSRAGGAEPFLRAWEALPQPYLTPSPSPISDSTKPNPNQIISVGSKPGMNGAGFQKGLTCESCHSQFVLFWGGGENDWGGAQGGFEVAGVVCEVGVGLGGVLVPPLLPQLKQSSPLPPSIFPGGGLHPFIAQDGGASPLPPFLPKEGHYDPLIPQEPPPTHGGGSV